MIEDLLVAEFNDAAGKRIFHSKANRLSESEFDAIDEVLLPKDELCLKYIVLQLADCYLTTIPILLRSSYYKREKYVFGAVLLVAKDTLRAYSQHIQLMTYKLGAIFAEVELQSHIFFQCKYTEIVSLVDSLFLEINKPTAYFLFGSTHSYFSKHRLDRLETPGPSTVLAAASSRADDSQKENSLMTMLSNGTSSLRKISLTHNIDLTNCRQALKNDLMNGSLLQHSYFDLQNRYELKPQALQLEKRLDQELLGHFRKEAPRSDDKQVLLSFLLGLNKEKQIGRYLSQWRDIVRFKVVKLLRWACLQGLLRQVQELVFVRRDIFMEQRLADFLGEDKKAGSQKLLLRLEEGARLDDLCVQHERSKGQWLELVRKAGGHVLLL